MTAQMALTMSGFSPFVMSAIYLMVGVIPIVIYFLEVRKRTARAASLSTKAGDQAGTAEGAELGSASTETERRPAAKRQDRGSNNLGFTIRAEGGYVTVASVYPVAQPDEVRIQSDFPSDSFRLNTVWESHEMTSSDDGTPSFVIKAKVTRDDS